ncbi:MAG: metallophosphoesterase [Candidatus Thorarchaeota archaeon]|nr:metallophosphoesterase [Candidatus Thorarchaeota archaeon]
MKIAAVSDIHVRPHGKDKQLVEEIRHRVEKADPDVFVIAGDISDRLDVLGESLASLTIDDCINLFVAGNHDVWFSEEATSLEKYSKKIGRVCQEAGWMHLPDEPYIHSSLAFVGTLGWSDYSFRVEQLDIPMEAYRQKEYNGAVWRDYYNIDWTMNDQEVTQLMNRKLKYDLDNLPEDVTEIVSVSHHLPFENLVVYKNRLPWDFFSAYMGAKSTGEILRNDKRVFLTISGHSHVRSTKRIDGITAVTAPIGYCRPPTDKLDAFVDQAVAEIEIQSNDVTLTHFVEGNICTGLPYPD